MPKEKVDFPQTEGTLIIAPETELAVAGTIETTVTETKNDVTKKTVERKTATKTEKVKEAEEAEKFEKLPKIIAPKKIPLEIKNEVGLCIKEIPLEQLHAPEFNPFNIKDDEAMVRLVDSIKQHGVREPGIARKSPRGSGYELLVGNRRKRACELVGLSTMPVIIRELDNDNAVITLVDSNLQQREELLFSEKAWAYKIKMEALSHRGIKGEKSSAETLAEQTGDSRNQIFRLIRLTELVIDLLDKVDAKQIAFNPAVELSYLSQGEQLIVVSAMAANDIKPSLSQAVRLKNLKQSGELTEELIHSILSEEKANNGSSDKEVNRYRRFFPADYTPKQMHEVISDLLMTWQMAQIELSINLPTEQPPKAGVPHE